MLRIYPISRNLAIAMVGLLLPPIVTGCGSAEKSFGGLADAIVAGERVDVVSLANGTRSRADDLRKPRESERAEPMVAAIKNSASQDTSRVHLNPRFVSKEVSPMPQSVMPPKEVQSAQQAKVEHVDPSDFREKVLASDVPVLVDFYADWCGPCRMLTPILEQVARDTPGTKVVKVNIDHSPRLAELYRVTAVPTMMVFKDGVPVAHQSGLTNKDALQKLLAR
jgi:thioredoxin 1